MQPKGESQWKNMTLLVWVKGGYFSQSFQFTRVIYWYRFRCRHINFRKSRVAEQTFIPIHIQKYIFI